MKFFRSITSVLAILLVSFMLVACESKVTPENYKKITKGMTKSQVEKILGKGEKDESHGGFNVGSAGLAESKGSKETAYVWNGDLGTITVIFDGDGLVVEVRQQGLE